MKRPYRNYKMIFGYYGKAVKNSNFFRPDMKESTIPADLRFLDNLFQRCEFIIFKLICFYHPSLNLCLVVWLESQV